MMYHLKERKKVFKSFLFWFEKVFEEITRAAQLYETR